MNVLNVRRGIIPIMTKTLRRETNGWLGELVNTIAIPITFFLAFGLGLRGYISEVDGLPYIAFITPGLISMTIMLEAYRTGSWGLWLDRCHQYVLDEYRVKPVYTQDIIIGEILGGFIVGVLKGLIVALILLLLTAVPLNIGRIFQYLVLVFPGCIVFTCLGCLVGTTFNKPDQIAKSQTIFITPLLYLGGLFFPITALPAEMLPVIKLLPTTAIFDGGRETLINGGISSAYMLVLLVWGVASFIIATWWFNRRLSR